MKTHGLAPLAFFILLAEPPATGAAEIPATPVYALDFVATAATGHDLNDAGDVVGREYVDNGCAAFCLPPQEIVLWRGRHRVVLPLVPGFDAGSQYPLFVNEQGLIGGVVGSIGSATHAAAWTPDGAGYVSQDLGVYPGTSSADVAGLDEQGRMVGWSTLGGAIPTVTVPFSWSQATGMVDLEAQGYPDERPLAMSPGGRVVTWGHWYQLGDLASVEPLPAPPAGFFPLGSNGSAIDDAGDQAHILVSTSAQHLAYPFRLSREGAWQMLSNLGTGQLAKYGIGSIDAARNVTFTAIGTGMIAPGPDGVGETLASRLSTAYPGATVDEGGPMNASGQILARVLIGRSPRVVKMTPATPCSAHCLVSNSLTMTGKFVQDPRHPDQCFQGGSMHNRSSATVTITSESGAPIGNARVKGRFLDDYWTDHPVAGTTDAAGVVKWVYRGPCGVGAVAFLVEQVSRGARTFDRTRGTLTGYVIPK